MEALVFIALLIAAITTTSTETGSGIRKKSERGVVEHVVRPPCVQLLPTANRSAYRNLTIPYERSTQATLAETSLVACDD